jgi:Fibrinogen beta and gamma chains, C-terminal globular domain
LKLLSLVYRSDAIVIQTGNNNTYEILSTRNRYYKLRVDLSDFNNSRYAVYDNFSIDSPKNAYKLTSLGTYSGTAGKF